MPFRLVSFAPVQIPAECEEHEIPPQGLPEIGVTLGFVGLFGFAVQGFLAKYPCIKVSDVLDGAGGHGH